MKYFDIHSHIYIPDYDLDREEIIARMKVEEIYTTSIGTDLETSKKAIELAEKHENLFASVGMHPIREILSTRGFDIDGDHPLGISKEFETLAQHPKVVAIGECGFDLFRTPMEHMEEEKKFQKKIFEEQVDLAVKYGKGLMLHSRPSKGSQDAYEETLAALEARAKVDGSKVFGNAHFFAGNQDMLKRFLDIGFTVSFTGVITFTHDYDELVRLTPLESIHAETDAPYVAPVSHRGGRNSPEYVVETVAKIAELKGLDVEVVKTALIANAKRLFRLA